MAERTPEEWAELKRELTKIVKSPLESRERRQRAQTILDSIPVIYTRPRPAFTPTDTDFDLLSYENGIL